MGGWSAATYSLITKKLADCRQVGMNDRNKYHSLNIENADRQYWRGEGVGRSQQHITDRRLKELESHWRFSFLFPSTSQNQALDHLKLFGMGTEVAAEFA